MKLMRAARQDERFRDERALASPPEVAHLVILGSIASILEASVVAGVFVLFSFPGTLMGVEVRMAHSEENVCSLAFSVFLLIRNKLLTR